MNKLLHACLLLICLPAPALADNSFKCGNRIVSLGNSKAEVLLRCGTPDWRDDWSEQFIETLTPGTERRTTLRREVWLYDPGPTAFQRILTFENGRLMDIAVGSRGRVQNQSPAPDCAFDTLGEGVTQYEVLQRCGVPFFTDSRHEESLLVVDKLSRRVIRKRVDEWTYNLGPSQFVRILTFENGRLRGMSSGARGE